MKYAAHLYAKALAQAADKPLPPAAEKKMIANFLALVKRNGDEHQLGKIIAGAERLLRARSGRKKFLIETARPLSPAQKKLVAELGQKDDIFEEKIDPSLVAGIKVTMDEEQQFDGSLAHKLDKLFRTND